MKRLRKARGSGEIRDSKWNKGERVSRKKKLARFPESGYRFQQQAMPKGMHFRKKMGERKKEARRGIRDETQWKGGQKEK